ncbi:MAG: methyltransferase domain-containing protein [Saprospiraceae bacterium]
MSYLQFSKHYKWNQHFQLAWIRKLIVRIRFIYYVHIRKNLKIYDSYNNGEDNNTIHHNLKGLVYLSGTRVLSLIHPLSAIDHLDRTNTKVLAIGPRTEGELFLLLGVGFEKKNIKALDLISYSPWVTLGDMHAIPFLGSSFDVVILGWVMAYSHNPKLAAENILKVSKNGAIVCISVEYANDEQQHQLTEEMGYMAGHYDRLKKTDQILDLFGEYVDKVYLRYDIPDLTQKEGNIYVIFSIKK